MYIKMYIDFEKIAKYKYVVYLWYMMAYMI